MKHTVLSIGMLLSMANIYCMDRKNTSPRELSSLEIAFMKENKDGDTPIHIAVKHYQIVNELKNNLNPLPFEDDAENISDSDDMKKSLAEEPLKKVVRLAVNQKILADAEVPDIQTYEVKTTNSIVTCIQMLHKLHLDLNIKNKKGETALHLAAQYKMHTVVQTLLELGADPNIADKTDYTPLMIACAQPYNKAVISALLNGNADVNVIINKNNKTNMDLNELARICIENANAILEHLSKQRESGNSSSPKICLKKFNSYQ